MLLLFESPHLHSSEAVQPPELVTGETTPRNRKRAESPVATTSQCNRVYSIDTHSRRAEPTGGGGEGLLSFVLAVFELLRQAQHTVSVLDRRDCTDPVLHALLQCLAAAMQDFARSLLADLVHSFERLA